MIGAIDEAVRSYSKALSIQNNLNLSTRLIGLQNQLTMPGQEIVNSRKKRCSEEGLVTSSVKRICQNTGIADFEDEDTQSYD
jgi:hypothetical protein